MGATLTVTETSTQMIRLVNGKLVQEEAQRNIYMVPPKSEYEWEITGYALPFEMPKAAEYGGGMQTKTRLEFTITSGKGAGKMFTVMYGFSIGQKANLGKLARRLNVDLSADENGRWDLDRMIGYKGKSYVGHGTDANGAVSLDESGKPKYATVVIDTVEPISGPDQPYAIDIDDSPAPTTNGNGNHAASDDGWE